VMNLHEKKEKEQLILHPVNFKQDLLKDIPVELKVDGGKKVKSITLISKHLPKDSPLTFTREDEKLLFRVPEPKLYDMLVIQPGPA